MMVESIYCPRYFLSLLESQLGDTSQPPPLFLPLVFSQLMAANLITSLLSQGTSLLSSIRASSLAPSSSSSSSSNNNSENERHAVEENLEGLMRTLQRIKPSLYDAEEREIGDRSVKLWLKELKRTGYDADDVLSEYRYEATRVLVEARKASQASGSHKRKKMEASFLSIVHSRI